MTTIACKSRRGLGAAVAVLIGELWAAQVQASDYDVGSIHIAQPWARATPKGAKSGAGYLTITNNGSTADRLSCVSSDASAKCEVHIMIMENGVMKMRPAEGGLEIKPGETVMLKPSSAHPGGVSHRRDRSVGPRRCRGPGSTDDAGRRHNADEALDPNSADCRRVPPWTAVPSAALAKLAQG